LPVLEYNKVVRLEEGGFAVQVSSSELKTNLGKYLDLLGAGDIIITRNGRKIAKLVKEEDDVLSEVRSLFGVLAGSELARMTEDEIQGIIHEERSKRNDRSD